MVAVKSELDLQLTVKNGNETIGNIYIESNINDVYNQLNNINQIFIIGTAISLFITVILGFFIARTITRPITDMRNQTVEMSKGNYTQRVKIYGNDEIGELALAFNNLSKRVQEAQANTESEKRRLDSVITHMVTVLSQQTDVVVCVSSMIWR